MRWLIGVTFFGCFFLDSDSESTSASTASEKNPPLPPSLKRKTRPSSETEKEGEDDEEEEEEEDDEEDDEDGDSPRRLITRSSTVKAKRSSLLGISKGTDSDSENGKGMKLKRLSRYRLNPLKPGVWALRG